MKTPYQVSQELDRLERLVPHIIADQPDRAEEILGFHIAGLRASSAASEATLIEERTTPMLLRCRQAQLDAATAATTMTSPDTHAQLA